ncbi:hypothetical protein LshimejAT787_0901350 [Lyophyllum shimeji]|uniref:Uncharacterized protein n=1 Tax=Lyophyllum shimeji TaxID=47721 RepID=A0A9P3PQP5_LYOSH|nr:hypothetical protein LshimejAT787_0901350 [Lyophyllum shimeji]
MAPLTVKVSLGDRLGIRNEAAVRSTLHHLSRVKHLSLAQGQFEGYDGPEEFKSLIRLLDAPAPLLETLDVTFRYGRNDESSLPVNLFSGNAPRLANLRISRCGLNWRSPIFANLRSLKVIDPPVALRPPADQFLSALSSIPRLEILEFRSDFASTGGAVVPHVSTAVLPLLTNLTIASPLLNAVLLLNHITYPTTACVAITCAIDGFRQDSDRNLSVVHGLASLLGGRVDGPIRSLAVHEQGIRAWTSPGIEPSVFSADKPQLSLDFSPLHTSSDHINDITQNVLRPLPLRHVESLLIQCVPLPETAWLDHFGGLARLKTLHVGSDPFGFLNAFSTGTSAALEQSRQAGSPKFKALRTLGISDWTFDEFHGPHVPGGRRTSCFESLVSCLKARRKEGVALSELVVEDCHHVDEADISDLEKIVAKVEWDREANYTEEEEPEYESDEYYDDGFAPFFNAYWY